MHDKNIKSPPLPLETKLVEVIPISRGVNKETLTYFTTKPVTMGSLVSAPLRKKTIPALVTSVRGVEDTKSEIKDATYSIKKLSLVHEGEYLLPAFIKAAEETARYFLATTGAVIEALTPRALWSELEKHSPKDFSVSKISSKSASGNLINEKYLFQTD